jgi:hypothetical protein
MQICKPSVFKLVKETQRTSCDFSSAGDRVSSLPHSSVPASFVNAFVITSSTCTEWTSNNMSTRNKKVLELFDFGQKQWVTVLPKIERGKLNIRYNSTDKVCTRGPPNQYEVTTEWDKRVVASAKLGCDLSQWKHWLCFACTCSVVCFGVVVNRSMLSI